MRDDLLQAARHQSTLDAVNQPSLRAVAALRGRADGQRFGNVLVAVDAPDLLDQIFFQGDIRAERGNLHVQHIAVHAPCDAKAQTGQAVGGACPCDVHPQQSRGAGDAQGKSDADARGCGYTSIMPGTAPGCPISASNWQARSAAR